MSIKNNYKKYIYRNAINSYGLKSNQKLLAIESDDWGSVRVPSKQVYDSLKSSNIKMENCPYSKYDALETNDDLNHLFNTLSDIKDKNDNFPIITTNFLTANPDFEAIKKDNFVKYSYESLEVTYSNYNSQNIWDLIRKGIEQRLISPQFHGREHLNISMWMALLKKNRIVRKVFEYNMFALSFANSKEIDMPYLASFMESNKEDENLHSEVIDTGIALFEKYFHYKPISFIAPVYIWSEAIENHLKRKEFQSIQGLPIKKAILGQDKYKKNSKPSLRFLKPKNRLGQVNLIRNCFFEPSTNKNYNWLDNCLEEIKIAFAWGRPAIICSHRLNYAGRINVRNRESNLRKLEILLKTALKKWPDIQFVSSEELTKMFVSK